jgi:hypothetical protein
MEIDRTGRLLRYKNEFTDLALQLYADGAHGISTYNWHFHLRKARAAHLWTEPYGYGIGGDSVQAHLLSILGDPRALREYRDDPEALPTEHALFPFP